MINFAFFLLLLLASETRSSGCETGRSLLNSFGCSLPSKQTFDYALNMSRYVSVLTEKINILSGQFSHKELEIDQLRTLLLTTTNQLKQSNAANVALKAKLKSTKEALQKSENEIREKDKKYARLFSDYNRLDACAGFLKYRLAEITTEKETVEGLLKERQGAAESLRKQSEEEQKAFKSLQKSSDFCIEDRSRLQNFVSKQSKFLKKWENYLKTCQHVLFIIAAFGALFLFSDCLSVLMKPWNVDFVNGQLVLKYLRYCSIL